MITIPFWALFAIVVLAAYSLHIAALYFFKWMMRNGGLWHGKDCPACRRPHESKASQFQRQLRQFDEQAYDAGFALIEAIGASVPEVWQKVIRDDKHVIAALDHWTRVHNRGPGP